MSGISQLVFSRYGPGETCFPGVGDALEGWKVNSGWGSMPWGNVVTVSPTATPLKDYVTRPKVRHMRVVTDDALRLPAQICVNDQPVNLVASEIDAITFRLRDRSTGAIAQTLAVTTNRIVDGANGLLFFEIPKGWHSTAGHFWADIYIEYANDLDLSYGTNYVLWHVRKNLTD